MVLDIIALIKSNIDAFHLYAKEYPFLAGGIGLWMLGVVSYILKGIPSSIWSLIKRNVVTKLTIINTHESYYNFIKWYSAMGYNKHSRYIKISNGMFGESEAIQSLGYGCHYFWYNFRFIIIDLTSRSVQGSTQERDEITMTMIGRSHTTFNKLFDVIKTEDKDRNTTIVRIFKYGGWELHSKPEVRGFNTIYLREGIEESIIDLLKVFKSKEDFHKRFGIPYHTGILLHGPHGTGKTSIIKAIANHLNSPVHQLDSSDLGNIKLAMSSLPRYSLLVIEDIDRNNVTHENDDESSDKQPQLTNIGDILNSIDGIYSTHGTILIITTNHIEKLDPALIRSGRIDLTLEVGYSDEFSTINCMKSFYPEYIVPVDFKIKDNVTSADIQNLILNNLDNPDEVINEISI